VGEDEDEDEYPGKSMTGFMQDSITGESSLSTHSGLMTVGSCGWELRVSFAPMD
jgi:hypothetical protein